MFKTTLTIVMAVLCLKFTLQAQSQNHPPLSKNHTITGKVISATTGEALPGAVIKITTTNQTVLSNDQGAFTLSLVKGAYNLSIYYLSHKTNNISIQVPLTAPLVIALQPDDKNLQEVEIVSTGYQNIPKERATGSFTRINTEMINRSPGGNIINRLEGITSGLLLNRGLSGGNNSKIAVHGRSTIFANAEPLIVLNGFPYQGTIEQINPADIETIDVLKDAAAASIWGSRSGNGVVVITTKTGRKNQHLTIGVNSALTITNKPNLYYEPQLSSSDFIELEEFLFAKGYYNSRFSNPYNIVSSAVEIFNQRKTRKISAADSAAQIDALKRYDIRHDLDSYSYRNKVEQQHQLNLSGGTENITYYLSGGYNKNLENKVSDSYDRITLNASNNFSMLKNKLSIVTDIGYASSNSNAGSASYKPYSPYDRIADENGNALPVVKDYRMSYVDTAGAGKLLDWHFYPKKELLPVSKDNLIQYRIKVGVNYQLFHELSLSASYQFLNENSKRETNNDLQTYYTRNLINQYSSIAGNAVSYVIPPGSFYSQNNTNFSSKVFRLQLNYNKVIGENHEINAIAGYEGNDDRQTVGYQPYYGYDPETLTHANSTINPLQNYKLYYANGTGKITTAHALNGNTNINQSYYTNVSYAFNSRYIVSGSVRRDESNLFGVKSNQKGVPLWSAGIAWHANRETFYNVDWLPALKLRLTYGYNGNVDNSVSAFLTTTLSNLTNINGHAFSAIGNPPNPDLRWEKVKTWNTGIDFTFKNNRINGSIDLYKKNAIDLIGNNLIAFQSGLTQYRGNGANLETSGIDVVLNSKNLSNAFAWSTSLLFNYNTDQVTRYSIQQSSNLNIINSNFQNPLVGYPYHAIFSFPSAGLDAAGAPQGFLNGVISKDYAKINSTLAPDQIRYHGSASPKYFGSIINTFSYKNIELSLNVIYKFDYYFRRINVFSGSNYGASQLVTYALADYEKRWQKPGDERTTKIPALTYPSVAARNTFFNLTEDLVERGDHIRLQDIRLAYRLTVVKSLSAFLKKAEVFMYARNLGILWRKNKVNMDPDIRTGSPLPFSGAMGININL